VENKTARGRNSLTTPKTDRRITRFALKNKRASSGDINKVLREMGVKVSDRTVQRRLVNAGLRARIARKKPHSIPECRAPSKKSGMNKRTCHMDSRILEESHFSGETRISVFGSDGVRYVRRRPGEDCLTECLTPTMKHPLSVMMWGAYPEKELVGSRCWYIKELWSQTCCPRPVICYISDFIFQQDGTPCHTARVCTRWFQLPATRCPAAYLAWKQSRPQPYREFVVTSHD